MKLGYFFMLHCHMGLDNFQLRNSERSPYCKYLSDIENWDLEYLWGYFFRLNDKFIVEAPKLSNFCLSNCPLYYTTSPLNMRFV